MFALVSYDLVGLGHFNVLTSRIQRVEEGFVAVLYVLQFQTIFSVWFKPNLILNVNLEGLSFFVQEETELI